MWRQMRGEKITRRLNRSKTSFCRVLGAWSMGLALLVLGLWWKAFPVRERLWENRRSTPTCYSRTIESTKLVVLSQVAIGIVTCTSARRSRCDDAGRHTALVEAQLRTWAADALRYGAKVIIASDAPWPETALPLPAGVLYTWFPVPSPRALRLGFERHGAREGVFRPESNRTRQMLAYATAVLPSAVRFFIKIDDDAYLRLHRIAPLLELIDSRKDVYLGSVRTFWGCLDPVDASAARCEPSAQASALEYAMGGAGYVLTRPLVEKLVSRMQSCVLYNGEDKDLAACLSRSLNITAVNVPGFWYGSPKSVPPQQRDSMIAFHKLHDAADMEQVHRRYGIHATCVRVDVGGDSI